MAKLGIEVVLRIPVCQNTKSEGLENRINAGGI